MVLFFVSPVFLFVGAGVLVLGIILAVVSNKKMDRLREQNSEYYDDPRTVEASSSAQPAKKKLGKCPGCGAVAGSGDRCEFCGMSLLE